MGEGRREMEGGTVGGRNGGREEKGRRMECVGG